MSATGQKFSRKTYEQILQSFREAPGNVSNAARNAGVDFKTAKRLWEVGWPKFTWARPIQDMLEEERQKALATVAERMQKERSIHESERERARVLGIETKAAEEQLLLAARKNIAAAFGLSAKLVPAMDAVVGYIRASVLNPDGSPKSHAEIGSQLSVREAMGLLARHAATIGRAYDVAERIIQLGRTERNEPNVIVGHVVPEMSAEEAAAEIEEQEQAIEIIRREGAQKAVH